MCWLVSVKAGIPFMSHLTILPTAYTRSDLLESSLRHEGFNVVHSAVMAPFNGNALPVDLLAHLADDIPSLGWTQGSDGCMTMVADLQRLARYQGLDARLQRVARQYALLSALESIDSFGSSAEVTIDSV